MEIDVHKAKAQFAHLLRRVIDGEEVTFVQDGMPVARMVRIESTARKRPLGMDEGKIYVSEDFNSPLPPPRY